MEKSRFSIKLKGIPMNINEDASRASLLINLHSLKNRLTTGRADALGWDDLLDLLLELIEINEKVIRINIIRNPLHQTDRRQSKLEKKLTKRQIEVFRLHSQGVSIEDIAHKLNIMKSTVVAYLAAARLRGAPSNQGEYPPNMETEKETEKGSG